MWRILNRSSLLYRNANEGEPSAGITGRVIASKAVLRNAVVTAWLLRNGKKREIVDDFPEGGRFELRNMPAGTYLLTLSADYGKRTLGAYTQTVKVQDGSTTEVLLTPKKSLDRQ
jgi:hypothetical protein